MNIKVLTIVIVILITEVGNALNNVEMEILDLVEEIEGKTFYEFMNISHDATTVEIRKAYKNLSLIWHHDKNVNGFFLQNFSCFFWDHISTLSCE